MMEVTIKEQLVESYNHHAEERNGMEVADWKARMRGTYLQLLEEAGARKLLEIGAGPGRDSLFFQLEGLDVTSTDLSPEMVRLCREKGLKAHVMDFGRLDFPDKSFDGVYALNCLLHVPKQELPAVLAEIRRVLKPGGLFFLGVYGGPDSEGIWEKDHYVPKRFFSMYSDTQLLSVVEEMFRIVRFETVPMEDGAPHFQGLVLA
ncbi:class I SAM-dependent methyltransferase [Paenibacillus koleovorans]|uniref:class I SAM-dependent methyltransferase n=1 Tax=Paenibacillus koleovorans TaxID=121608 RepID=UPI000FDB2301|nr:class I SAM-dependent methyltransferase [Paenibacillus koleovorans]